MSVCLIIGDCREELARMDAESVHCVVTSPPYWGLRDYGVSGQIGLEASVAEHIETLVAVFREVRRVLRPDGTLWLNYGDAYAANRTYKVPDSKHVDVGNLRGSQVPLGLKPKDLIGLPWRLAFALQADGWWLRSDVIWAKPNPMPESVRDRPTRAHEYVFLLSKAARYWYDADAIRTEAKAEYTKMPDGWDTGPGAHGSVHRNGREKGARVDKQRGHGRRHDGFNERWDAMPKADQQAMGANARTVWEIATEPFSEAHFATFPTALAKRCIKAGCPVGGTVLDPFGGAGTTGLVADRLQRNAILIELNPEYAAIAKRRLAGDAGLFGEVEAERAKEAPATPSDPLTIPMFPELEGRQP